MTATERRRVVNEVQAAAGVSERRAIRFTGFPRSTVRYRSVQAPQTALVARIHALAAERPRWGYRWIHRLLVREGWPVNRTRVQRLYRAEGLAVRRRRRRRRSAVPRPVRPPLTGPQQRWSLDFVHDALRTGRPFRCLTVLVTDNGSEFTSRAFDAWAYSRDVRLDFIQPGKPQQNAFIESFNGTFRDDCLNLHWFPTLDRARLTIDAWRHDYNQIRPHSSLGERTPAEFLAALTPERETALQPEGVQE